MDTKYAPIYEPDLSCAIAELEGWVKQAKFSASVGLNLPASDTVIASVLRFSDFQLQPEST